MSEERWACELWSGFRRFVLFAPLFPVAVAAAAAASFWGDRPTAPSRLRSDRIAEVQGVLAGSPERSEGLLHLELEPESIRQLGRRVRLGGRVAVQVYSDRENLPERLNPPLGYGERIRIRCFLTEPSHFALPGVPDFRSLQRRRGIVAVARLKSPAQIERIAGRGGCPVLRPLFGYGERFREFCEGRFENSIRSLVLSAFLGERRGLDESDRERIRRLGAFHLFVVSGFHVSLVLAALHWPLRRFGWWGRGGALAATWGYVILAGASPSGVRAGLMTTIFYLLWAAGLQRAFLNGLAATALLLLALRPALVFEPGFQFSFLSLAAIGLFAAPWGGWLASVRRGFAEAWSRRICLDRSADGRRERKIRFFLEEWTQFAPRRPTRALLRAGGTLAAGGLGLLVCNLWIQLLTFPLALRMSNRLVWTQALANLALVPLFSLFVPVCLALFALFQTPLAGPAAALTAVSGDLLLRVMSDLESISFTSWTRHPGVAATVVHVLAVPAAAAALPGRWKATVFAAPLLYVAWARLDGPRPSRWLTITMLDVGQGESLHLRYPNGLDALVDAGGLRSPGGARDFVGERLVGRYLWEEGASRLEFVQLSHPHLDHVQGLRFLRPTFAPRALHYHQWDDRYRGLPGLVLKRGDSLVLGGVEHRVLHPGGEAAGWSVNDSSLVTLLRYKAFTMVLTGDIEQPAEAALRGAVGPVTVLKVPHHGGAGSASAEFLRMLRPRAALVSAGRRNLFGHPSEATLRRLIESRTPVFSTAVLGTLRVETDGVRWRLSRYSIRRGRFVRLLEGDCSPSEPGA